MQYLLSSVEADGHVGTHRVVRHREQRDTRPPAFAQPSGYRRQRQSLGQQLTAQDVRRHVKVAEAEPVRTGAVGGQLAEYGVALAVPPPALLLANTSAERVHDRVEVWTHLQAERHEVVTGVADHGDVGIRGRSAQAAQEPGGTDPAGQNCDAHAGSLPPHSGQPGDAWRKPRADGLQHHGGGRSPENLGRMFTSYQGNRVANTTYLP